MSLSNVVGAAGSTFFGSLMAQVGADRGNGTDVSSGILRSIGSSLIGQTGRALPPERTASGMDTDVPSMFSKAFSRGFLAGPASGEPSNFAGGKVPQTSLGDGSGIVGGPAPGPPSIFIGEKVPQSVLGDGYQIIGGPAPGPPSIFIGENEKVPQSVLGDGYQIIGGPAPGPPGIFVGEQELELSLPGGNRVTQEQAAQLVGMSLDDAVSAADANGWQSRVSRADGEQYVLTMDFRSDRINFEVNNGVVTDVKIG